ncbi:hypothetical protein, conserved [Plasmodium gonderi]|uniref:Uncharacterized protein n=1 Tax=Plasmodium gonderi TaxID=77519 RepID=A0A1Y1JH27_PLAGO|nr:hypothetical protein, conserved [Plasmodium gonderi]GAW80062.1 hypothetical protein, conserved [Plasmodium gonderi]
MEKSTTNETMVLTLKNLSNSKWSSLSKKKIEDKSCYSPRTEKLIDIISPILDYYGYNKDDVYNFISLYKFDIEKIQLELCNIMESREENEENLWETVKSKKNKKPIEKNGKKDNLPQNNTGRKGNKQIGKILPKGFRFKEKDLWKNKSNTGSSFAVDQHNKSSISNNNKVMHFVKNSAKYEDSSTLHEINKHTHEENGLKEKQHVGKNARKLLNIKSLSSIAAASFAEGDGEEEEEGEGENHDTVNNAKGIKSKKGAIKSEGEKKKKGINENYHDEFLNDSLEERDVNKKKKKGFKESNDAENDDNYVKSRENDTKRKANKSSYNNHVSNNSGGGIGNNNNNNNNSHFNNFDKKKYTKLENGKGAAEGGGNKSSDENNIKKDSKSKGTPITNINATNSSSSYHASYVGASGHGTTSMSNSANRYSNFSYHDKFFNKNYNRYNNKTVDDSTTSRNGKQRFPPFNNKSTNAYNNSGNSSYYNSYGKGGQKQPNYLSKNNFKSKRNSSKNNNTDYDPHTGEKLSYDANNNNQSNNINNDNENNDKKKMTIETKKATNEKANANTSYASVVNRKIKKSLSPSIDEMKNMEVNQNGIMNTQIESNNKLLIDEEKKEKKKKKGHLLPTKNNDTEKLWVSVITKGTATSANNNNAQNTNEKIENHSGLKKNAPKNSKELKAESCAQGVSKKSADQSSKSEKPKKKGKGKEKAKEMENITDKHHPINQNLSNEKNIDINNDSNLNSRNDIGHINHENISRVHLKNLEKQDGEEMHNNKVSHLSYNHASKNEGINGLRNINKLLVEMDSKKTQSFVDHKNKMEKETYVKDSIESNKKETSSVKKMSELKFDANEKKSKKSIDLEEVSYNDNNVSLKVRTRPADVPTSYDQQSKKVKSSKMSSNNYSSLNLTFSTERLVSDDLALSESYDGKEQNVIPIYMPNLSHMSDNNMNKKIFFGNINITGNQIENIDTLADRKIDPFQNKSTTNNNSKNHSSVYESLDISLSGKYKAHESTNYSNHNIGNSSSSGNNKEINNNSVSNKGINMNNINMNNINMNNVNMNDVNMNSLNMNNNYTKQSNSNQNCISNNYSIHNNSSNNNSNGNGNNYNIHNNSSNNYYNSYNNNYSNNKMLHFESRKRNSLRKNYSIDSSAMSTNNDHLSNINYIRSLEMHQKESDNNRDYDHNNNDFRSSKEREFRHFDFKNRNQKREDNGDMLNENRNKYLFSSSNNKNSHVNTKSHNLYIPKIITSASSASSTVAAVTGVTAGTPAASTNNYHHLMHNNNSSNTALNKSNQNDKQLLTSSSSVFMNPSPRTSNVQDNSASLLLSAKNSKYIQNALKNKNYDRDDDTSSIQLSQISQKFFQGHQISANNTISATGACNLNGNNYNGGTNNENGNNENSNNENNNNGNSNNGNSNNGSSNHGINRKRNNSILDSPITSANIGATISAKNTGTNTSVSNKNTNTDTSNINLMNTSMNNLSNNNMYSSYNSPPGLANQYNYSFTNLSYPYNNMHYNGYSTQTLAPQYGLINNNYSKNNSAHNNNYSYNMNYDSFDDNNIYGQNNNVNMNNYINFMNANVKKRQLNNTDDDDLSNSGDVCISGSLQQSTNLTHENQNSSNKNSINMNNNNNNSSCLEGTTNKGINNLSLSSINMNGSVNPNLTISRTTSATSELKNKQQISKTISDMQLQTPPSISSMKQNQGIQNKGINLNATQQQHSTNHHNQNKHTGQQQHQQNLLNNNNNSISHYTQSQINPNNSQNTASSTSSSITGKAETNNLNIVSQNNQSSFISKQLYHNGNYYNPNSNNYRIPPGFNISQDKEQNNTYLNNSVSSTNANTSANSYRNSWNSINEKNLNHYSLNYNYNRSTKNNYNYTNNLNYSSSNGYNGTRDSTSNFFNYNNYNYTLQTPPGLQNYYQSTQYQQQNNYNNRNYNYSGYNNNLSMWNRED